MALIKTGGLHKIITKLSFPGERTGNSLQKIPSISEVE